MQAVIMAGGKGTRLLALTKDEIPKPMAPVNGKPILHWQIEQLKEQGMDSIILVVGHLGHKIKEYFQDGAAFGVKISYVEEQEPLGTAGALSLLPPLLTGEDFFLIFGDVLFQMDLQRMKAFHQEHQSIATLAVHPNGHPYDSDLVVCERDGRITAFDSKHNVRNDWYHNCVNAGLYLLNRSLCDRIPPHQKTDLEKEVLSLLIAQGGAVYGYPTSEYIKDVGTPERIARAEEELGSGFAAQRCLTKPQKAIFLDRDGTVNRKNGLVYQPEQFELEAWAVDAIRAINQSGYLAILITNQPVVARGLCSVEDVEKIHQKLETLLGREGVYLDGIFFCPHHPDKGYPEENPAYKIPCHCRKPDIGMIEQAKAQFHIDLSQSWMVGDSTVDLQTGKNAGVHTALVLTGDAGNDGKYERSSTLCASNLKEAVEAILAKTERGETSELSV